MKSVIKVWNHFWFAGRDLRGLAAMRILLAGTLFFLYLLRGFYNLSYFTPESMVPRDQALTLFHDFMRPPFGWFFWPDSLAPWAHALLVLLLFLITFGVAVRPMIFLAWVLQWGFIQRNYSVVFGADVISAIFMLYLSGTHCCEKWTLKNWLKQKLGQKIRPEKDISEDLLSSLCFRLIQIQIAVIYAYTGFEKLKGSTWWDGTALWNVFANTQMVVFDLSFMSSFPLVIALVTFSTLIFEIYWPMAVITGLRPLWLFFGLGFHLGIGALMNLWAFSFVMLSTYFLFVDFDVIGKRLAAVSK